MDNKNLKIKRTHGSPKLEYNTFYMRGFEKIEDRFLLLKLSHINNSNFELRMPLNHLQIKENKFIVELNIHDDDNRFLYYILNAIYEYNGVILDDLVGEDGILHNVDIRELCDYVNSMSMLGILLYFDDNELVYLDFFRISFPVNGKYDNKSFKNPDSFKLDFSIVVNDVDEFYERHVI